jgi:hypothetical protein
MARTVFFLFLSLSAMILSSSCALNRAAQDTKQPTHSGVPTGNFLNMTIESSERTLSGEAHIAFCYDLPSDLDWVPGRLPNDVRLNERGGLRSFSLSHFDLIEVTQSSGSKRARRCDNLVFYLGEESWADEYILTVERIAASIPADPDWDQLEQKLVEEHTGIVIERLPGAEGLSFSLKEKPAEMTDLEAHDIVVGMADPVVIGPWRFAISLGD